jgi:hypothetical protein
MSKSCRRLTVLQISFVRLSGPNGYPPRNLTRYFDALLPGGTAFFYLNHYSALFGFGTVPILAEVLLTTTDPRKAGPTCL